MTPERRVGAIVAISLAALALVLSRVHPREHRDARPPTAPPPQRSGALPTDALAYVPASTLVLVVADLEALRRAPATRPLFATSPLGGSTCANAIAQRVRRVALVVPRLPVDDFAFIAEGDISEGDFTDCAGDAEPAVREGVRVVTVRSHRDGGTGSGSLAWTRGIVLSGSRALVDAMLERGFDSMHGDASPMDLAPLRRHADERAALWSLARPSSERVPESDPLAGVMGAALSADVREGVSLRASLLCDDSARARRVSATLGESRAELANAASVAPMRALVEGATIEPDGAKVKVSASLDAAGWRSALEALQAAVMRVTAER